MVFQVHMKTPDAIENSVINQIEHVVDELGFKESWEYDQEIQSRVDAIKEICQKWFQYGEMVTLEIDTDKMTCVVLPN